MKIAVIVSTILAVAFAIEVPQGSPDAPHIARDVNCPDSYCNGLADGNYEYPHASKGNTFLQCFDGQAECQVCWPTSLVFSAKCNQCLYNKHDECMTTVQSAPAVTSFCPDKCPHRGPTYSGNIADSDNAYHYVACFNGATVGCVNCPNGLQFNEGWNACLYDGKHITKPSSE